VTVRSMSVIAFHEKAGRSQVSFLFLLDKVYLLAECATVAMLPFAEHSTNWSDPLNPIRWSTSAEKYSCSAALLRC